MIVVDLVDHLRLFVDVLCQFPVFWRLFLSGSIHLTSLRILCLVVLHLLVSVSCRFVCLSCRTVSLQSLCVSVPYFPFSIGFRHSVIAFCFSALLVVVYLFDCFASLCGRLIDEAQMWPCFGAAAAAGHDDSHNSVSASEDFLDMFSHVIKGLFLENG